jgi:hypothetical protein
MRPPKAGIGPQAGLQRAVGRQARTVGLPGVLPQGTGAAGARVNRARVLAGASGAWPATHP